MIATETLPVGVKKTKVDGQTICSVARLAVVVGEAVTFAEPRCCGCATGIGAAISVRRRSLAVVDRTAAGVGVVKRLKPKSTAAGEQSRPLIAALCVVATDCRGVGAVVDRRALSAIYTFVARAAAALMVRRARKEARRVVPTDAR